MNNEKIDVSALCRVIRGAVENLRVHADEVNELNVFPIPDGDTGSNMLLTSEGALRSEPMPGETLGSFARRAADGMLLAARGNSGVILSQFADGIAAGFDGLDSADVSAAAHAFSVGVEHAYSAVMEPVEGTILTVMREAAEKCESDSFGDIDALFEAFLRQARETLEKTPEMLPVLKSSGVVDSGGAGLVRLAEGAVSALCGEQIAAEDYKSEEPKGEKLDLNRFTEDSVLEFGYCTELLLRLQRAKVDLDLFDVDIIKNFLSSVGESVVCFRTGSIVKIHVHTFEPYRVLEFCQRYGEYLTVKIENMSLQHNNLSDGGDEEEPKRFGFIAYADGDGIAKTFREMGVDLVIGEASKEAFASAYRGVNAETTFVFPNGAIVEAKAAADGADGNVRVVETHTVGECYAALSMLNTDSDDADQIEEELNDATVGVATASVIPSGGVYVGVCGAATVSSAAERKDAASRLADALDFTDREICIIIRGADSDEEEGDAIASHVRLTRRGCEVFVIDGGQKDSSYIFILE